MAAVVVVKIHKEAEEEVEAYLHSELRQLLRSQELGVPQRVVRLVSVVLGEMEVLAEAVVVMCKVMGVGLHLEAVVALLRKELVAELLMEVVEVVGEGLTRSEE